MRTLLNFVEWAISYFHMTPEERKFIRKPRFARSYELRRMRRASLHQQLEIEWQLFKDDLLDLEAQGPLLPRSTWFVIYRIALSLPVCLTISLYLLRSAGDHPLFAPMLIGMTAIGLLQFQFITKLLRVTR